MRQWVVIALLIGFAMQGFNAFAAIVINCHGPASGQASYYAEIDRVADVTAEQTCCVQAEVAARTGDPCQEDQSCQSGQQLLAPMTSVASRSGAALAWIPGTCCPAPPAGPLGAVWRPPTLI